MATIYGCAASSKPNTSTHYGTNAYTVYCSSQPAVTTASPTEGEVQLRAKPKATQPAQNPYTN